jgi:hypothetical protein
MYETCPHLLINLITQTIVDVTIYDIVYRQVVCHSFTRKHH